MKNEKIIRVFPRRTAATPIDNLSYMGYPPSLFPPEADKIHLSITFSWDLEAIDKLEREWRIIAPVEIGGPATGSRGEEFVPGRYIKHGYVITSRGCPNHCWFCSVPTREGALRELPITEGWNILDDNLLACSDGHIKAVFKMLSEQKQQPQFTGGLEAARLREWHIEELIKANPVQFFFAYDTPDDYEPLCTAGKLLNQYGLTIATRKPRCYVLIGYPRDTFEKAEKRLYDTIDAGFIPYAMLWMNERGIQNLDWKWLQWDWSIHMRVVHRVKKHLGIEKLDALS